MVIFTDNKGISINEIDLKSTRILVSFGNTETNIKAKNRRAIIGTVTILDKVKYQVI